MWSIIGPLSVHFRSIVGALVVWSLPVFCNSIVEFRFIRLSCTFFGFFFASFLFFWSPIAPSLHAKVAALLRQIGHPGILCVLSPPEAGVENGPGRGPPTSCNPTGTESSIHADLWFLNRAIFWHFAQISPK